MMKSLFFIGSAGLAGAAHLRSSSNATELSLFKDGPPCQCLPNDPSWKTPTRTEAKCIFIDLGAADGNTFDEFVADGYGKVSGCPNGKWEALLVEANPQFTPKLKALEKNIPGVHSYAETAAYSCAGQTSFFIDTDKTHNHWGSSMSSSADDVVKSGKQKVTVPTVNVAQLIAENVLPGDWVMLKVDIESAEYSVIPCLAQSSHANLVDRLYLEEHTWFKSVTAADKASMADAKTKLKALGVDIPVYYSPTL
eukprot:TRINITY_DN63939_c0_g1_i1.p1 TRINITY_DN63939_c0_g1~~TRINITY_DN63939_c0_g1_i1.p1  ORF type:complete len:252 (-),score=65.47 TRINITY_DN63939_c0_g1_i1:215-970(-)